MNNCNLRSEYHFSSIILIKSESFRGSAPDPTGGAHSAPPDPLADFIVFQGCSSLEIIILYSQCNFKKVLFLILLLKYWSENQLVLSEKRPRNRSFVIKTTVDFFEISAPPPLNKILVAPLGTEQHVSCASPCDVIFSDFGLTEKSIKHCLSFKLSNIAKHNGA